jgi:hypothetical protein
MVDLYIAASGLHGRGVFAGRDYQTGELLEDCPVLVLTEEEVSGLGGTILSDHIFDWKRGAALALGHTSLLNHSYTPNAAYEMDYRRRRIRVRSVRPILRGEEITVNYGGAPNARPHLWFEAG